MLKRIIVSMAAALSLLLPVAMPAVASAQLGEQIGKGACFSTNDANCEAASDPEQRVNDLIKLAINIFSIVVGVISVIMIIVGGLKYITSGGESGSVTGAKNTIMYAVIGLVVVAMAQFIVQFVLKKANDAAAGDIG